MNRNLYDIIMLIIWIILFVVVGTLFIKLLPYLIIIAAISWIAKAIIRYFADKKENEQKNNKCDCSNGFNTGNKKVIDVDYTEVKDKKP